MLNVVGKAHKSSINCVNMEMCGSRINATALGNANNIGICTLMQIDLYVMESLLYKFFSFFFLIYKCGIVERKNKKRKEKRSQTKGKNINFFAMKNFPFTVDSASVTVLTNALTYMYMLYVCNMC